MNHKRVHRFYRDEGLSLRFKRPRRHVSRYEKTAVSVMGVFSLAAAFDWLKR